MTIAYVLHNTSLRDGSSKSFRQMITLLSARGVKAILVFPDKGPLCRLYEEEGYPTIVTPYRPCTYPRVNNIKDVLLFVPHLVARIVMNLRARYVLTKRLKQSGVEMIHTNVSVVDVGYQVARRLGVPHIYHVREYPERYGYHFFPSRTRFLRELSAPDSYSISITHDVCRYLGQQENTRSAVIYNPVVAQRAEMPHGKRDGLFLFAARVEHIKGFDLLLQAYIKYVQTASRILPLYVAGSFSSEDFKRKTETAIRENHLQQWVVFLGERDDVAQWMERADATIVASRFEGFGRTMAEAQANGCLVIGLDNSGTKEQFDNGLQMHGKEIGLRCHDVQSMCDRLTEVASQPEDYFMDMRWRAFQTVQTLYSREAHVNSILELYHKILVE